MLIGSGVGTKVVLALKFMLLWAPSVMEICSSIAYPGERAERPYERIGIALVRARGAYRR